MPARGDFGSRRGRNNLNKDTLSSLNNGDTLSPRPTGVDRIINKPGLIFTLACHLNASLPRVLTSEPCATLALRSDYDENRVSSSHLQLCGEPGAGGGWVPWRVEVRIFRNATRSEISNVRKYHLIREVPAWISSTPCSLHIQADRSGLLPLRHPPATLLSPTSLYFHLAHPAPLSSNLIPSSFSSLLFPFFHSSINVALFVIINNPIIIPPVAASRSFLREYYYLLLPSLSLFLYSTLF